MRNEDIKEILEAQTKAVKAEIKATTDLLGYKLDEVINHQKITNGRVTELEDKSANFDTHINNTQKAWKHRKIIAFALIILIFGSTLVSTLIVQNIDAKGTIEKRLNLKLR